MPTEATHRSRVRDVVEPGAHPVAGKRLLHDADKPLHVVFPAGVGQLVCLPSCTNGFESSGRSCSAGMVAPSTRTGITRTPL